MSMPVIDSHNDYYVVPVRYNKEGNVVPNGVEADIEMWQLWSKTYGLLVESYYSHEVFALCDEYNTNKPPSDASLLVPVILVIVSMSYFLYSALKYLFG